MRREFVATIGGRERVIAVSRVSREDDRSPGDVWQVTLEEHTLLVDARPVRPGTWSLLIEGRSYVIDLDPRQQGTAILRGMVEIMARLEDARQRALALAMSVAQGPAARGGVISAPIAGKVVAILVEPGDEVTAGQSVAVLEAMKMENELEAEQDGTVEAVHVAAGQSVETGDRLITLA